MLLRIGIAWIVLLLTCITPSSATLVISDAPLIGSSGVSLGISTGKTNQLKTGTLTTTAVTADQVVLTYTVTAGKTFYLEYVAVRNHLTAISAVATLLGTWSLETPSGTKTITMDRVNPTTSDSIPDVLTFMEPIPIAAGVVVRVVTTPAVTTSILWRANFGGYEK